MAHQPSDDEAPTTLTTAQVLEMLSPVVPYMPVGSRTSLLAMVLGVVPNLPSHEAPTTHTAPTRPFLASDVLRSVVQAKTVQHLRESDSAFEAKQWAAEKISKKAGGYRVTKRYAKPLKNKPTRKQAVRTAVPSGNICITPYGVPWGSGDAPAPGNIQVVETVGDSATYFHRWDLKDPSSSVRKYSPT